MKKSSACVEKQVIFGAAKSSNYCFNFRKTGNQGESSLPDESIGILYADDVGDGGDVQLGGHPRKKRSEKDAEA